MYMDGLVICAIPSLLQVDFVIQRDRSEGVPLQEHSPSACGLGGVGHRGYVRKPAVLPKK